jgi:hypothetical protein
MVFRATGLEMGSELFQFAKAKAPLHLGRQRSSGRCIAGTPKSRLLEGEQAMGHGIEVGRGGFWIELNEEKYQVLRRA